MPPDRTPDVQLLADAEAAGVTLAALGGRLRVTAAGPIPPDLRRRIADRWPELTALVAERQEMDAAVADSAPGLSSGLSSGLIGGPDWVPRKHAARR
jgi:hypothetical protein